MRTFIGIPILVLIGSMTTVAASGGINIRQQPRRLAPASPESWHVELIPGMDYSTWYQTQTGYTPNANYFGAYAIEPMTDTLFIGFGTARPAENDGALLVSYDGTTLQNVYEPMEQGFIDMTAASGTLYIPGADPCCPDNWDWGNTYIYTPPNLVIKHRNLPYVLHSWGLWFDVDDDTLYAAVSSHLGNDETWTGEVFSTTDQGASWTRLANRDDGVGQYRTYDIIGFNDKLYATWNDVYPEPCGLAESSDGGANWTRFLVNQTSCRTRLAVFNNKLLALKLDRSGVFAIDTPDNISTYDFPGFQIADWAYNYLAADASGYLCTLTDDGRVVRTSDFTTWETLASTDLALASIAYWPNKNRIIFSDHWSDGKLWKIDLATASGITLPQAPQVTITRSGENVELDWADITNGYRVYRSTDPYFASYTSNKIANPAASALTDNNIGGADVIGNVDNNYFYLARSEDAAGSLSLDSNRVGEFDFAIVPGD